MGIVSHEKGIHNWLKKNGYLAKNKYSDIIVAYESDTKDKLIRATFYSNRTYGKLWDKSQIQFKMFSMWVKAHIKK